MRTPVSVHVERVAALLAPLRERPAETVPLLDALGRVTAADVASPIALPPFTNSQMDGFAVRAADVADAPVTLPVPREIAAAPGAPGRLEPGTAIRIMTGAPIPAGADAVVPVEDTRGDGGTVTIERGRSAGEYVRAAGSDLPIGGTVLLNGSRLESRHLAAVAASGLDAVSVRAPIRVAVISTGSELVAAGEPLGAGQIPDANGVALASAARASGALVVAQGRVADDPAALAAVLDDGLAAGAELLLTSGGISMGDHEVVRELLEPLGAHVDVLAMQPGGPQATATYRGVPVVCFPGNPVSSQLSFELFVAPVLREIAGLSPRRTTTRPIATAVRSVPGKRQLLRGRLLPEGAVTTVSGPGSHLVVALAASDVIIDVPEDVTELSAGDPVETWEL
jgi:molybdopterin molybdotransferase